VVITGEECKTCGSTPGINMVLTKIVTRSESYERLHCLHGRRTVRVWDTRREVCCAPGMRIR
jgi:hypothetical protein